MKFSHGLLFVVILLFLGGLVSCDNLDVGWPKNISGGGAQAQSDGPEYLVSFVCGTSTMGAGDPVQPGEYSTLVNVFNPSATTQTASLRVSLSFPPSGLDTGEFSGSFVNKNLSTGRALQADCASIRNEIFSGSISTTFFSGYLVVQGSSTLDVTATYTVGAADSVSGVVVRKISAL